MANKSDGSGFDWDTLWAAWRAQPLEIQRLWMAGENGLAKALKETMERYPKDVQDEMFGHAPKDVQKYFGYVSKESLNKKKPAYNENYRSALLEKIRGLS
jgi:hypothetical protein